MLRVCVCMCVCVCARKHIHVCAFACMFVVPTQILCFCLSVTRIRRTGACTFGAKARGYYSVKYVLCANTRMRTCVTVRIHPRNVVLHIWRENTMCTSQGVLRVGMRVRVCVCFFENFPEERSLAHLAGEHNVFQNVVLKEETLF